MNEPSHGECVAPLGALGPNPSFEQTATGKPASAAQLKRLHPDPELSGPTLPIQAKSITTVLILCSTPPHSSSFQPTPAKVRDLAKHWLQ